MNDEQYADWAAQVRADHSPDEANRILETGGPEQHAATIREALLAVEPDPVASWEVDAIAALDALVALADDNEGLRFLVDAKQALLEGCQRALEAAEERASQLEHERDKLRRQVSEISRNSRVLVEDARREADQLRAALEQIALCRHYDLAGRWVPTEESQIARAALADVQAKEPT